MTVAETIKILVNYGADINTQNKQRETALLRAAAQENIFETVKYLLQNVTDFSNSTVLHFACRARNNIATIQFLLENGFEINTKKTKTLLHLFTK